MSRHSFALIFSLSSLFICFIQSFIHGITPGWKHIRASERLVLTQVTEHTLVHPRKSPATHYLCAPVHLIFVLLSVFFQTRTIEKYCSKHLRSCILLILQNNHVSYFQVLSVANLHIKCFPVRIELSPRLHFNVLP